MSDIQKLRDAVRKGEEIRRIRGVGVLLKAVQAVLLVIALVLLVYSVLRPTCTVRVIGGGVVFECPKSAIRDCGSKATPQLMT